MNQLNVFESEEYGKEYIVVDIELDNFDFIPGFIRTIVDEIKRYNKYVKIFTHDNIISETEYFESSVRSNKKGAAYIDRNGVKHFYIMGKKTLQSEGLQNMERNQVLRQILNESLEDTELPRSGL